MRPSRCNDCHRRPRPARPLLSHRRRPRRRPSRVPTRRPHRQHGRQPRNGAANAASFAGSEESGCSLLVGPLLVGQASSAVPSGSTRRCTASRYSPTTRTGPGQAAARTGCWSDRTAAKASAQSSSKIWPPAATSGRAAPTPYCWSTCHSSGQAPERRRCRSHATPWFPIPGHGKDKINSAFATGGASLLIQTVEQATGLRLDHYAEIGFSGFAGLVDALGGVTVCPTTPINDPLAGIDLPAGCQQLKGRDALGYVRTRDTPRADLDRMINQRQFMSALLHRAASPAVWLNPWRWYSVPRAAADALTVDQGDTRLGPRPARLGAARIPHHIDGADRIVHRQRRGLGGGLGRRRGRQAIRRAGRRRASARCRARHTAVAGRVGGRRLSSN